MTQVDALARLYDRFAPRAYGLLVRLVHDRVWAEDLLHDAFLRVAPRLSDLREEGAARTYLFRAAANLAIDGLRAKRRAAETADRRGRALAARAADRAVGRDTAIEAEDRDLGACVRRGLDGLPDRERVALVLRVVEGFGYADVAEAFGLTDRGAARLCRAAPARLPRRLSRTPTFAAPADLVRLDARARDVRTSLERRTP